MGEVAEHNADLLYYVSVGRMSVILWTGYLLANGHSAETMLKGSNHGQLGDSNHPNTKVTQVCVLESKCFFRNLA